MRTQEKYCKEFNDFMQQFEIKRIYFIDSLDIERKYQNRIGNELDYISITQSCFIQLMLNQMKLDTLYRIATGKTPMYDMRASTTQTT